MEKRVALPLNTNRFFFFLLGTGSNMSCFVVKTGFPTGWINLEGCWKVLDLKEKRA